MMNYHVLTLFPEMILDGLNTSIIGRAIESEYISLEAVNIRDYADNKHNKVDDYPYGGGAGMVMQAEPVYQACESVQKRIEETKGKRSRVIYVTPQGRVFNQTMAEEFAREEDLIFLCGHYEGIDERVLEEVVTDYISIGDYVLTGGELPAMVMIDAISRLVPNVLSNEVSAEFESFHDNLLEYPQYSRPEVWHEKKVPTVLLSGNHTNIEGWRREHSILRTKAVRPDLYERYRQEKLELEAQSPKKRRIKGVIFDMDGCLLDSEKIYLDGWKEAFKSLGYVMAEDEQKTWPGKSWEWVNQRVDTYTGDRTITLKLRKMREDYSDAKIAAGEVDIMPHAIDILKMVKESGLKLGLATSTPDWAAIPLLQKTGLYDYFDELAFGNQVKEPKPAPDIYRLALKKLGLKRTEAIAFEDSTSGVHAAKNAGIRVVYIPNDERGMDDKDLPYYQKISDFAEGMAIVRRLSGQQV